MVKIHPSSFVDSKAEIADDVEIGPFCTVGPHVKIGCGQPVDFTCCCGWIYNNGNGQFGVSVRGVGHIGAA